MHSSAWRKQMSVSIALIYNLKAGSDALPGHQRRVGLLCGVRGEDPQTGQVRA